MRSTTAIRTSMASADRDRPWTRPAPRIGLLGVMQALYDEMLPGITERQAAYAREVAAALDGVAEVVVGEPARDRGRPSAACASSRPPASTACSS